MVREYGLVYAFKQWGYTNNFGNTDSWWQVFPIQMEKAYACNLTRGNGSAASYVVRIIGIYPNGFFWSDSDINGHHGNGDANPFIVIGS